METIDRIGTFDEVLEGHTDEVRTLARRLRSLIAELDRDVIGESRAGRWAAALGRD